jgi:hypothetical protein
MLWKTARMIGCLECQTTSQVTTAMTVTVSHPSIRGIGHENDDAFGAYRCHRHRLVGVRPARRPRDASRQAWRPRGAPRQADAGGDMGIAPARLERAAGSISARAMTWQKQTFWNCPASQSGAAEGTIWKLCYLKVPSSVMHNPAAWACSTIHQHSASASASFNHSCAGCGHPFPGHEDPHPDLTLETLWISRSSISNSSPRSFCCF